MTQPVSAGQQSKVTPFFSLARSLFLLNLSLWELGPRRGRDTTNRLDLSQGLFVFIPEVKLCEFLGGEMKSTDTPQPLPSQCVSLVFTMVSVVVGVSCPVLIWISHADI